MEEYKKQLLEVEKEQIQANVKYDPKLQLQVPKEELEKLKWKISF